MNENEMNSIIDQLKNKFPTIAYEEAIQKNGDGELFKIIRISFQGIAILLNRTVKMNILL